MLLNLFGVFVSFAIIIFLIRKKINFGLSIIIGSLILSIFSLNNVTQFNIIKKVISKGWTRGKLCCRSGYVVCKQLI